MSQKLCIKHEPVIDLDKVKGSKWVIGGKEVRGLNYHSTSLLWVCGICGHKVRSKGWVAR